MINELLKDWERINPANIPTLDWITLLGEVNANHESLLPWWLEGWNWKEDSSKADAIAPLYLHVTRLLNKIGDRRRYELLRIQKLKSRSELTNEAFPDQETFSEGSEDNLDLQDDGGWSDELDED